MGYPTHQYKGQLRYIEEPPIVNWEKGIPHLTLACILDKPHFKALDFECQLIQLNRDSWEDMLKRQKPHLLIIEAFSEPEDTNWFLDLNSTPKEENQLVTLISWCKVHHIPTIFWQLQCFVKIEPFKPIITLFDYVFTADLEAVSLYTEILGKGRVHYLPPALQPKIHNPTLEAYPRNAHEQMTSYHRLLPSTKKTLLELSEVLFPQEQSKLLDDTLNPELKDKLLVLLFRELLTKHTYKDRLNLIARISGIPLQNKSKPGVTILTATNRTYAMENILSNYTRQDYPHKELIIILNNDQMIYRDWVEKTQKYRNVRVYQVDEKKPLGYCLNLGVDKSQYGYITKFDDDNYYGPYFLTDLMNSYQYANVDIVGKLSYYVYLEETKLLGIMCPYFENMYTNFVAGSGLIIKKEVFNTVRFGNKPRGSDSVFIKECVQQGIHMYSADRFNYVVVRHPSHPDHTWKISDEVFLNSCKVAGKMDDYIPIVRV